MNLKTKPAAQLSLELILQQKRHKASELLQECERIETEMNKVLSSVQRTEEPAPASRLVDAFNEAVPQHKNGVTMERMATENAMTLPPASQRLSAERDVVYAAIAMVHSWQRRHKKNFHNQERELMETILRLEQVNGSV